MNQVNDDPSQFNRSNLNNTLITKVVFLNKKRKIEDELLGLPLSKHKCFAHKPTFDKHMENEDDQTYMMYEDIEKEASNDESGQASAKGSNSFVTDSDSSTSTYVHGEEKSEPGFAKAIYSLDSRIITNKIVKFEEYHDLDEHLLEFEELVDYKCSEYENDTTGQCQDKDPENVYVLSSGRWSVKPGAQMVIKKPTIDQEFEQYFSSLMLQ